jgi:hypothetical protein
MTVTRSSSASPDRPGAAASGRRPQPARRIRWGRIPGRLVLALCFALGALALGAVVIPFSVTTEDGAQLHCGPAVFESLMPADPAFDDTSENVRCAEPAKTRLLVSGGVLVAVVLVAAITERRTRRGSLRRDTQWLSSSSSRSPRRGPGRRAPDRARSRPEVGEGSADGQTLPAPRR